MAAKGALASISSVGIHQFAMSRPPCIDRWDGLVEVICAIFALRVGFRVRPAHSNARRAVASSMLHSSRLTTKRPGWPLVPDVELTQ